MPTDSTGNFARTAVAASVGLGGRSAGGSSAVDLCTTGIVGVVP